MEWRERIHSDAGILAGKPIIKGTRMSVEFLLRLFAVGWTKDMVFESYPHLTEDDLRAIFSYAAEVTSEERGFALQK